MEIIKEFVPSFFIIIIIIMMISCIYWDEKSKLYDYFFRLKNTKNNLWII